MSLKWYLNRLKLMTPQEVLFFRIPQLVQHKFFGHVQKSIKFKPEDLTTNPDFKPPIYLKNKLDVLLRSVSDPYLFRFFQTSVRIDDEINWRKDYKSGTISETGYYASFNRQDFNRVGDIKYVNELARMYFLPFLAFWELSDKQHAALEIIERLIRSFNEQNPFLNSIHWTSGIEIGIRSINLVYTHMVLSQCGKLTPSLDDEIKLLILRSFHFLKNHPSKYSSANNHRIAELAGLVAISSYFKSGRFNMNPTKWMDQLCKEINAQFHSDGVNREMATHYHVEVLDHILNAITMHRKAGFTISADVEKQISRMFDFVEHIEYNENHTVFGDNDNGYLLFPHLAEGFSIHDSLMKTSNHLYQTSFYSKSSAADLRNYLMFGESFTGREPKPKLRNQISDRIFEESGYAFLYDHSTKTKLSFDFGPIGDEISAAHGHSDILHVGLEVHGIPVLIDPGTYQYHKKQSEWRNYFRGVSAHNTISINGLDQAFPFTRMSWISCPKTSHEILDFTGSICRIKGSHYGYHKIGIVHSREITFLKSERRILISDSLKSSAGTGSKMTFFLNFNPDLDIIHRRTDLIVHLKGEQIVLKNRMFGAGKLISGHSNPPLGWVSESFDSMKKGKVFYFEDSLTSHEITYETEITY